MNKKLLLWILAMLLPLTEVAAAANLSIEAFSISGGETKEMVIDLSNPEDEITLVQFDLRLPTGISLKQEGGEYSIDMCDRTTWRKHSLDASATEGIIRFLLASSSNTVISGTEGAIIKMTLVADASFAGGAITLENILLVTPDEKEIKPANVELNFSEPAIGLTEGRYYIKNVATGLYITNGGNWGTHIAVGNLGLDLVLKKAADGVHWNILSGFTETGALGTEGYVDLATGTDLTIVEGSNGAYNIIANNNCYLSTNSLNNLADFEGTTANDTKAMWMFVGADELQAERMANLENATELNPIDATFLITCPNLNNSRDQRMQSWIRNTGAAKWSYGIFDMDTEPIMEIFRSANNSCSNAFTVSQAIALRPGKYKLQAQGFYRDGDYDVAVQRRSAGNEQICAYLFAGEKRVELKSIFDSALAEQEKGFSISTPYGFIPNTMTEAGYAFQKGLYDNELEFVVTDATNLEIGIGGVESYVYNNWTAFDNFRLTYYGKATEVATAWLSVEEPFSIAKGGEQELLIDLNNPDDEITLVQFDLRLPDGLTLKQTNGDYDIDIAGRTTWRKHSLDANLQPDGSIRFLLSSTSNAVLSDTSGAVIKMTLQANSTFNGGAVQLVNTLLVCPNEKEIKPDTYQYEVKPANVITITAKNSSREYGEDNPTFEYEVSGGTPTGTPSLTCVATKTSDVGTYEIVVGKGTLQGDVVLVNGTLTITKAPLTASVGDYTREEGHENPDFVISYSGWKNSDNESVLTKKPTATTTATTSSAPGTYPITVSGGEAKNYEFTYKGGTLTVKKQETPGTATLSIEPFGISAGGMNEMIIDLTNPDDEITLVQFDLRLPTGLSLKMVGGEYDINIAGRTTWKKHSLDANATDGIIRFLLSSTKNAVLEGTSGAIIKMTLVADNNLKNGEIKLENILLVTPEEKEIKPGDIVYNPINVGIAAVPANDSRTAVIYTLSGQRLAAPKRGINIIDGKKVVIK